MRLPFKMNISLKIFLGYFLLVGLAAWFVLIIFVDEVKPGVRQAMEDALVDTATVSYTHLDVYKRQTSCPAFAQSWAIRSISRCTPP